MSLIVLTVTLSSCDVLMQIASRNSTETPTAYTNAAGLKEALQVGLTNSFKQEVAEVFLLSTETLL